MKNYNVDLTIIGAGPAGLAAAIKAKQEGVSDILIIERDHEPGGILQQCIHDGFGLQRFGKRMSGPQYAQHFIDEVHHNNIELLLNTMVLEITEDKNIYACNSKDGILNIRSKTIILAMGCRERTQFQVFIYGTRPAGVLTAGAIQRYINLEGYLPGKNAVILGSGDIGLIMARRMTLEGINVQGVYEVMDSPGGLTRNIVQCLEDYNIPLHLSETVTAIHGKQHVESITVAKVDGNRKPIPGTEHDIECDLLVLAVGLIPENELSIGAGIELDNKTHGPILDENFMTNIPGIFAAGNVAAVFDLVDYVSISGEIAAQGAVNYLNGKISNDTEYYNITPGTNVNFVIPQRINKANAPSEQQFFLRVRKPQHNIRLMVENNEESLYSKRYQVVKPPEMVTVKVDNPNTSNINIHVKEM